MVFCQYLLMCKLIFFSYFQHFIYQHVLIYSLWAQIFCCLFFLKLLKDKHTRYESLSSIFSNAFISFRSPDSLFVFIWFCLFLPYLCLLIFVVHNFSTIFYNKSYCRILIFPFNPFFKNQINLFTLHPYHIFLPPLLPFPLPTSPPLTPIRSSVSVQKRANLTWVSIKHGRSNCSKIKHSRACPHCIKTGHGNPVWAISSPKPNK